jgi:hypothetical protein
VIKSIIIRVAIVLILILIVLLGKQFFYYSGFYSPPPSEIPSYEHIFIPPAPSTGFSDNYTQGEGTVLIDLAHDNTFDIEELNVLTLRLISRGLTLEFLKEEGELEEELLGEEEGLEEKLAAADAFIVVCPQEEFSKDERETVEEFVDNGGKLLLIADPTRRGKMNSLSLGFGLIFETDYLYNMKEYETNYRNIFVSEFGENEITGKLEKIALYTAGSISSDNCSIAFADQNTLSSLIETREGLSPMALANESKVLAIHDLTFITEPHNGILDNNQLIANIAGWLASPADSS